MQLKLIKGKNQRFIDTMSFFTMKKSQERIQTWFIMGIFFYICIYWKSLGIPRINFNVIIRVLSCLLQCKIPQTFVFKLDQLAEAIQWVNLGIVFYHWINIVWTISKQQIDDILGHSIAICKWNEKNTFVIEIHIFVYIVLICYH